MSHRLLGVGLALGTLLVLAGCAAASSPVSSAADAPGFFTGLWHGLILPITFVVSLFDSGIGIYAVGNSGHLYDLGFMLGAGGLALPGVFARGRR